MTSSRRFRPSYELTYGLRVCQRSSGTGKVESCVCRFCEVFGRDERVGGKRKRTKRVKYFSGTFRSDHIKEHLEGQHSARWSEYKEMEPESKALYFVKGCGGHEEVQEEAQAESLAFWFDKKLVDVVIGDVLNDSDDEWERAAALCVFEKQDAGINDGRDGEDLYKNKGRYFTRMKNKRQFHLVIDYVACGSSFRHASRVLEATVRRTDLASLGVCDERRVASIVRVACAANLQKISDVLAESWAFSIAVDASTNYNASYLDVRIRLCKGSQLHNLHLLAAPMEGSHTGEHVHELFSKTMDAISTGWRERLIGVSTDGAPSMLGAHQGFASRLEREGRPGFYKVWCAAHQLNLVVQSSVQELYESIFIDELNFVIGYLRRQQKLIEEMKTMCPRYASTRWLSIGKVVEWLIANRARVFSYLEAKNPSCKPSPSWWVTLYGVRKVMRAVDIVCRKIQSMNLLLAGQRGELEGLVSELCGFANVRGPLMQGQTGEAIEGAGVACGRFAVSFDDVSAFLEDLGLAVVDMLDNLSLLERNKVVRAFAKLFVGMVDGIARITPQKNNEGAYGREFPPVLPHELASTRGRDFTTLMREQRGRLRASMSETEVDKICEEHVQLVEAVGREIDLRELLQTFSSETGFEDGWKHLEERFPALCRFAGGLATIFPGTSTVESDFSLVKWERDEHRQHLSTLSLAGILHAKQFEKVQSIPTL